MPGSPRLTPLARAAASVALLALLAAGCAASLNVRTYGPRGVDIRQYRTYTWDSPSALATGDPRLDNNRFFDERVRSQVDAQLAGKGFEKQAGGTADLLLHYHMSIAQRIDAANLDRERGYCSNAECAAYVYDAGTLLIDLVDPKTNTLVWRGWAEGSMDPFIDNQDWMEKRVDQAVARILDKLPGH